MRAEQHPPLAGKYLTEHNRMDANTIREYHFKYSVNKVELKNKENYFNFKDSLNKNTENLDF